MKLLFLGTGAADWPLQKTKGQEHRRNSSLLIDDILLIDPGPGVPDALKEYGKRMEDIRYIINTHRHYDHWNTDTVAALTATGAVFYDITAGEEKQIGEYRISAYPGNHSTCPGTVHFIISDGNKNLFYGLDGAWLMYEEVQAIQKKKIDFAVLDATIGNAEGDYRIFEHNNLRMVREIQLTLMPCVKRFCISHMARTLHDPQKVLAAQMAEYGIETAYDGLETEI